MKEYINFLNPEKNEYNVDKESGNINQRRRKEWRYSGKGNTQLYLHCKMEKYADISWLGTGESHSGALVSPILGMREGKIRIPL